MGGINIDINTLQGIFALEVKYSERKYIQHVLIYTLKK